MSIEQQNAFDSANSDIAGNVTRDSSVHADAPSVDIRGSGEQMPMYLTPWLYALVCMTLSALERSQIISL